VYGADGAPLGGLLGLALRVVKPEGLGVLERVRGGWGRSTGTVGDLALHPVVVLGPETNAWVVEVICSGGLEAPRSHRGRSGVAYGWGMTPMMGHKAGLRARGRRGARGMEEGAEAAVTAPRLRGRAGRGLCGGADGGYDTVGFRGAEGDTGGGGCGMRGAGGGTMKPVDAHGRYI
jgi:hypothetical protein